MIIVTMRWRLPGIIASRPAEDFARHGNSPTSEAVKSLFRYFERFANNPQTDMDSGDHVLRVGYIREHFSSPLLQARTS